MTTKRSDYLSWDEYFMGVALLSAQRSKDPSTRVGACVVNQKNKIVGVGYNGFPTGCPDDLYPWDREGDFLETKYPYICHAELNAVINKISADLYGCRLYVARSTLTCTAFISGKPLMGSNTSSGVSRFTLAWR